MRLHRAGYRTLIMDSTTYEEANAGLVNWVRQRSRWIKGYMQTWLVHMRHPVRLVRAVGWRDTLAFTALVGGAPFVLLLNPWLWALTIAWYVLGPNVTRDAFPGWVYYGAVLNFFVGNFLFVFMNLAALARRRQWELAEAAVLSPLYWVLMSIAAWKALLQLIRNPSYWEKTVHGLASPQEVERLARRLGHEDGGRAEWAQ
jgi:cellulose synthase/poly-beta-1,6-N-acetylglucosamine synthase-like glycosyltransferase